MSAFPTRPSVVTREVARIAATPPNGDQVAEVLALIGRVIPYEAAWLGLLDGDQHRYAGLLSSGYDDRLRRYFDTQEVRQQVDQCGLSTSPGPQSLRDTPFPFEDLPIWSEYYQPAGLLGGMGVGLFTQDRRHLGMLFVSFSEWEHPTDDARDLIGALAPRLAAVVDPNRTVGELARMVRGAVGGVVLTRGGGALPLPGLPGHDLLFEGSELLKVAARQTILADTCVSFLWPASHRDLRPATGGDDDREDLVQVVVLGCPPQPSSLVAVVMVCPPPVGRPRLTRDELAMLGMLLDGWPVQRVAAATGLSGCAVVETIAWIVDRLGAPNRHTALLRAARQGWFIPHHVADLRSEQQAGRPSGG